MVRLIIYINILLSLLGSPFLAQAAFLGLSPNSISRTVGSTFTVRVLVNTTDKATNAVSGSISFPPNMFDVIGISKNGSIVNLWVQEPSYSNTKGDVSFEGVILNPGYKGSEGLIISVTFRAKSTGSASLKISSASVLANDGLGTNILVGTESGQVNILPVDINKINSIPTSSVVKDSFVDVPMVVNYDKSLEKGDRLKVHGISHPGSDVILELSHNGDLIQTKKNRATSNGDFVTITEPIFEVGKYDFTVQTIDEASNKSEKTAIFSFYVSKGVVDVVWEAIIKYASTGLVLFIIIIGVGTICLFVWYRSVRIIRHLKKEFRDIDRVSRHSFGTLHKAIKNYITHARKNKRTLSQEELKFVCELEDKLKEIEQLMEKEIKDLL